MNLVKINSINLWDEEWELGWINGSGQDATSTDEIRCKNYIPVNPSTEYYVRINGSYMIEPRWYDANKNFVRWTSAIGNTSVTAPSNAYYLRFYIGSSTTYNHNVQICLNSESDKTTYHPHWVLGLDGQGKAFTADLSSMLPSGIGCVDLGGLNWTYGGSSGHERLYSSGISSVVKRASTDASIAKILTLKYTSSSSDTTWTHIDKTIAIGSDGNIYVYDSLYSNAQTFKTAMAGQLLFYEKA